MTSVRPSAWTESGLTPVLTPCRTPWASAASPSPDDIDAAVAGLQTRGAKPLGNVERYEDIYRRCYVRGPEGIIVMLAEQIG